tara:strand:- start:244 stop:570 length:327 start_codon:yes stop_codon:yes gene_type:complete
MKTMIMTLAAATALSTAAVAAEVNSSVNTDTSATMGTQGEGTTNVAPSTRMDSKTGIDASTSGKAGYGYGSSSTDTDANLDSDGAMEKNNYNTDNSIDGDATDNQDDM